MGTVFCVLMFAVFRILVFLGDIALRYLLGPAGQLKRNAAVCAEWRRMRIWSSGNISVGPAEVRSFGTRGSQESGNGFI